MKFNFVTKKLIGTKYVPTQSVPDYQPGLPPVESVFDGMQNKRSKLKNVTKAQIVDSILESAGRDYALNCFTLAIDKLPKKGKRRTRRRLSLTKERILEEREKKRRELFGLTKDELVRISREQSDMALARRYRNTGTSQREPKRLVDREVQVDPKKLKVTRKPLPIQVAPPKPKKTKKRKKNLTPYQLRLARKAAKKKTHDWINAIRAHNKVITEDKYADWVAPTKIED